MSITAIEWLDAWLGHLFVEACSKAVLSGCQSINEPVVPREKEGGASLVPKRGKLAYI